MGIHKLSKIRDYWSVEEGLGNPLIQKAMTRDFFQFYKIFTLQIIFKIFLRKKAKLSILLGNFDPYLTTY